MMIAQLGELLVKAVEAGVNPLTQVWVKNTRTNSYNQIKSVSIVDGQLHIDIEDFDITQASQVEIDALNAEIDAGIHDALMKSSTGIATIAIQKAMRESKE
jgi:hypothetical protein